MKTNIHGNAKRHVDDLPFNSSVQTPAETNTRYDDLVIALQQAEAHLETLRRLTGNSASTTPNSRSIPPPTSHSSAAAATAAATTAATDEIYRSQNTSPFLLQEIDHQWGTTVAENDGLKAQINLLRNQQQHLVERQHATDVLLKHKDVILDEIKQAVEELEQKLGFLGGATASYRVDSSASVARQAPAPTADDTKIKALQEEKERQQHLLEQSLRDKEAELAKLQSTLGQYNQAYSQTNTQKEDLEKALTKANSLLDSHNEMTQKLEQALEAAESEIKTLRGVLQEVDEVEGLVARREPPKSAFDDIDLAFGSKEGSKAMHRLDAPASQDQGDTNHSAYRDSRQLKKQNYPRTFINKNSGSSYVSDAAISTTSDKVNLQQYPPVVETVISDQGEEYEDFVLSFRRNPQDPIADVSLDAEEAKQGGMAYLQQQMAHAVEVSKHQTGTTTSPKSSPQWQYNASYGQQQSSLPSSTRKKKFPLQPQAVPLEQDQYDVARPSYHSSYSTYI